MKRTEYYNAALDPRIQHKLTPGMKEAVQNEDTDYVAGGLCEPDSAHPTNLIGSLADDGLHYPVLDIDIPCRYVESTTKGHGHLYFDGLGLTWERYQELLSALVRAGIIEEKYFMHSQERGMTLVRPPHEAKYWVKNEDRNPQFRSEPTYGNGEEF